LSRKRKKGGFVRSPTFSFARRFPRHLSARSPAAGALNGLAAHRRDAQWKVEILRDPDDLFGKAQTDAPLPLQIMDEFERIQADYTNTGPYDGAASDAMDSPTTRGDQRVWRASDLEQAAHGTRLRIGGW
jgi:hypothetical protein